MGSTDSQVLQKQYAARWLELKHILTAKYFSDRDLASNRACLPDAVMSWQVCSKQLDVKACHLQAR